MDNCIDYDGEAKIFPTLDAKAGSSKSRSLM